jgi:hypothetical protein
MTLTRAQGRAVVAALTPHERNEYAKLPPAEAHLLLELHHHFPGARLIPEGRGALHPESRLLHTPPRAAP